MEISNFNFYKNKTVIPYLYGFLFALSIILINPWGGEDWGKIWIEPKLLVIQLLIILNLLVVLHHVSRYALVIPSAWKIGFGLWLLFLGFGVTSTFLSPFPLRSFWGLPSLGDGLFYWFFVAAFVVSNALLLHLKPKLIRYQVYGLLMGGVILALSIFIQVYDWRIDYTTTSGQISKINPEMLKSKIWKGQMPIGFYTNRGEVAFPLAIEVVLTLLGLLWGWIYPPLAGVVYLLVCTALFHTKCRTALLALLVALTCLLVRFRSDSKKRKIVICYGVGLFLVSYLIFKTSATLLTPELTSSASSESVKHGIKLNDFTSFGIRMDLWKLSLQGIAKRPLFGWGFDGLGIAFPFIADWTGQHQGYLFDKVDVAEILSLKEFLFTYLGVDGMVHVGVIMVQKAHNLIIDTAISVGIFGLISYISLLMFFLICAFKSTLLGIEAVAITYLVYTLTWYESGQFSHLGWWGLSVGLGCTRLFKGKKE
ncbi:O-antigen ligase family protein [Pleurocapsa sp. FMAR1]|uniref:O-antigen ligase family protein n=1 Tax=Pleurocapsa sp. FMAR1 TaxID=3040204 RepID=UPI0029C7873C|nr:O-antigen ligase family protein [Pleurocapsa sp. FMAR1]